MASLHWISYTIPTDLSNHSYVNDRLSASLAVQLDGVYYKSIKLQFVIESGEVIWFTEGYRFSDGGSSGRVYNPKGKTVKLLVYS